MAGPKADPQVERAQAVAGELRVVIGKLKRRLREQADPGDFTSAQLAVLAHLERVGPATVTALAKAESVRPQSMGATVAVLLQAGLVAGTPDPEDGRQTLLSLTAACRSMIRSGRAKREDWLFRSIRSKLSSSQQKQLVQAVELLKRIADS